jgi:hypothetical protein
MAKLKPDVVMLEALLPPMAMKGETQTATRDRLCGLNAIMMACARRAGVGEIAEAQVQDIRGHFILERRQKRLLAKAEVMQKCKELGWIVTNDNAADAVACWHYAVSQINPERALETSPLFKRMHVQ